MSFDIGLKDNSRPTQGKVILLDHLIGICSYIERSVSELHVYEFQRNSIEEVEPVGFAIKNESFSQKQPIMIQRLVKVGNLHGGYAQHQASGVANGSNQIKMKIIGSDDYRWMTTHKFHHQFDYNFSNPCTVAVLIKETFDLTRKHKGK